MTVGISAYNEQENIGVLISDLLKQQAEIYRLDGIVVISDGSNDNTSKIVIGAGSSTLRLIEHRSRKGKAFRVNEISRITRSDVLIILDADIRISDRLFINKLVQPFAEGKADLVSCRLLELPGDGFFEKVINTSNQLKRNIFEDYREGMNVYTCRGPVRAFSRRLYKKLEYPASMVCEDVFSFLYCAKTGYKYRYLKNPEIFYKSPGNLSDHQKQSSRFKKSRDELVSIFGEELVDLYSRVPFLRSAVFTLRQLVISPILMAAYFGILAYTRWVAVFTKKSTVTWDPVLSSKRLNI